MKRINDITKTRGGLKQFALGLAVSAAFFSTGPAAKAAAIPVPNGGFETLYKPGSTTITADTGAGWTQGVGPNANMEGGVATYSDATTGAQVDIPGWVNAPATGTPPNGGWAPPYGWPKGSGTIDRNNPTPYGSYYYSGNPSDWGNPYGAAIESDAPLATVESGRTYTLSMSANTNLSPAVLDLLANGVIVPSTSYTTSPDPLLTGWFVHTKTYSAASLTSMVGEPLKIRVGWAVGANGPDQGHLDNVQLKTSAIPVPNGGFETLYKPGSTTITADTGAGWTQGVGPNANMEGGVATYSDTTTGAQVDIPGWVNAPATGTPPNGGWAPPYGWPKGSGTIDRNNPTPYGSYYYSGNGSDWGNPYGAAIQSAAPLTTVVSGETYTLSASFTDDLSGKVLDLLADGVILTPDSAASTPDGAWTKSTKTYGAAILASSVGKSLTIRVGWAVGASGGQAHLDNVQLNSLVLAETTPPTLTSFEDNKSGGPIIENEPVTYTVTFSEAMSASTVDSTDFENASTTTATTINSVTPTADPAVFLVVATPTHAGTLQLQVKAGATLKDLAGNALNTTSALPDDTIIIVNVTPPSTACHMLTFGANVAGSVAFIDSSTVSWYVPYGNVVTALAPTYTLSFGATCVPTSGTTKNFTSPQTYRVTAQDGSTFKDYVVTATVAAESALVWSAGGGDWDFTTPNWIGQTSLASQPFANGLNVIFDATGVGGTINIPSAVYPLSTTVTNDTPVSYEFSGGPIAMGSLTKSGSGTLKIDVMDPLNYVAVIPNTYSGGTIMNGGLLHLGAMQNGISPLCTGTVGTGPVTLNGGTIELDRVTETNALIVFGGTLYSQNGWGATWGGPITLNGTLTSQTAYGMTYSGAIGGTGGLLKTGPDKLTLSVSNSYTGPTTVTSGTLQCNNADALGSGALSISSTTGTKVNLNYTGEHNVAALTLGGVPQTGGTYGSTASPATIKNDAYFAGTGMVRASASTANNMLTFSFGALGSATIDGTNIAMLVPGGTDVTHLAPTYTVSAGATGSPVSGTTENFTSPVTYTVTAEDGITTQKYRVTVTQGVLANLFAWTNTASGNWSIAANWTNDVGNLQAPLGGGRSSYTLHFNTAGTYTATNNLNDGFVLNQLNLGGPVLTLAGNGLAFVTNGPTLPAINQNSGSAVTIPNGLSLGNDTIFGGSGSGQVNLSGVISGAGSLSKNGSGTLRIYHVNNSFTGGTIINSGTLTMDIDAKLGTGPVTLNGGTLYMWRYHPTNALTVNGGTLLSENGFGNSWDGPITLNTNLPCNVLYTLICRGAISGPGGLIKTGNGPMTLAGVNTYTGPTIVTAGPLKCDNVNALGNGGALSISGTAMVNLNYSGDHVVTSLTLGGIAQPAGTYGSSGSGWGDDVHFDPAGTGTVTALASTVKVMSNVLFPNLGYAIPVDSTGTNLVLYVASGTPVTALAPTYDVSPFASGSPAPATSRDFTTPQTYTITAEDGSMAHYSVAVAPVAAGLGYSALVEATGPVAFWPLGELTGTTAVDVVGGHNATYSGTYTLGVAGLAPRSSAAAVDFVAGTATAPYSAALNPTQFSVECWVRPHNTSVQYLVSLQDRTAGGRIGYAIWKNNGSAGFGVMAGISTANNGVAVNGGTVAEAGRSYHVVGTYDGTTLKLYVNGNLEGSAVLAYMPATANQPGFTIASRNDATEADSDIQYVAVYDRALRQQEILTHYQNTPILKIGKSAGQVLLEWEFGIGLQHAAPDVNGTYYDVLSATTPWPITPSGTSGFWRLKVK